jgi:hypothetical protein
VETLEEEKALIQNFVDRFPSSGHRRLKIAYSKY